MCKMVDLKVGNRCIKVADIKKEYIQNIIYSIALCNLIDKVVLFGSALGEACTEMSDVDIAIFGKYPKQKMFRTKSYNDFVNSIVSYGDLQDYDMLYFDSSKHYDDKIFQDIKKGEILYERV